MRRRRSCRLIACAAGALLGAGVAGGAGSAQETAPQLSRQDMSLAAGYVAAFTCSATFNAGRAQTAIIEGELSRIYPDYRAAIGQLPLAEIDVEAGIVTAPYAPDMPPRVAIWRPHLGCVQAPPGSTAFDPPTADLPDRPRGPDPAAWPIGDAAPDAAAAASETSPALTHLVEQAFDSVSYGEGARTTAVVITQGEAIVAEAYAEGFDAYTSQRTWSVAKSIAATVIGAAVERGVLTLEAPAPAPEWSAPGDPRGAITLTHLLHMASGLDAGARGSRTDAVYFGGARARDHAGRAALEAPPGQRFQYANNDTLMAVRALRAALGDDGAYLRFPFEALLHRIGMFHTVPETDWDGDFILSSQVWTTARDLARLGRLYLNDGVWEGERILPEGWAAFVATPAPAQPAEGTWGYGAQFWLLGGVEGLPDDTYAAAGHRGQYVVIVPSRDVVVVRRGFDESGGVRFDIARFAADALAALEG